jgi:hypothetical protein
LGLEQRIYSEDVRRARDAETAHLEAVLKVNGGRVLRLAELEDQLRRDNSLNADALRGLELKTDVGEEPSLWLDLGHRVQIFGEGRSYRISRVKPEAIETVLETDSKIGVLAAAQRILAHGYVRDVRTGTPTTSPPAERIWGSATMFYIWLTGVVTGIAVLSLAAIYLKKLPF